MRTITAAEAQLGLASAEAARRLAAHGRNEIPEQRPRGALARAGDQLRDPMILLLLAAAAVTVALHDVVDTVVIGLVVVLNTAVGVIQELRAERTIRAVRRLAAPSARVIRAGRHIVIPAAEVVPGDLVQLQAGDVVPADARLVEAVVLQVDESALTGESLPVDKEAGAESVDEPRRGVAGNGTIYAGTVVTRGRARAVVTGTGVRSSLGQIAALIASQPRRPTPLQQRLSELSRILAIAALVLSAVVLGIGLLRGEPLGSMFITAVALAVAAVPESLPAVVTLSLALGAYRMARRHAVVRQLPAVETLGSVTVLASDKTGTLTEGHMVVERLWTGADRWFAVTGTGYSPAGEIRLIDGAVRGVGTPGQPRLPTVHALLRDVVLCNDADVAASDPADGEWSPVGDPMEAALIVASMKAGTDVGLLRSRFPRVTEIPFDSARRRMTTLHEYGEGWLVISKGAPEAFVANAGEYVGGRSYQAVVRNAAHRLAGEGYRVLAVAERVTTVRPTEEELDRDLQVIGLVGITDPLRPTARQAIRAVEDAGVQLMLVTGDHPATALTVAGRVGLAEAQRPAGGPAGRAPSVLTGDQLDQGPPATAVEHAKIFARIRPEQKLTIVESLQSLGHVVAMTGDGVNDGPALRRADIGVAMGRGGTEVARQAADLVLQDDNLATVVGAIEEGRRIYDNIRRFLRYALSGGFAEIVVMLVGPFVGLGIPLLPAQILWINMITHGLPGVALGAEPADPHVLRRAPRSSSESVLGRGLARQISWTGALLAAAVLGVGTWADMTGRPAQTMVFATLGLAQLAVAVALRSSRSSGTGGGQFLALSVGGALALQLAAIYLSPLQELLETDPLTASDLVIVAAVATVPAAIVRLVGRAVRAKTAAEGEKTPG